MRQNQILFPFILFEYKNYLSLKCFDYYVRKLTYELKKSVSELEFE